MKLKLLFIAILIAFAVSAFAQFTFKKENHVKLYTDYKNQLMVTNKYSEDDFRKIDNISLIGDFNGAYDICARARKINIDEKFLKELNVLQNVSLIRILVENGVIISINQIPEKSFNIFDIEKEMENQKDYEERFRYVEATLGKENLTQEARQTALDIKNYMAYEKSPFQNEQAFLARIATYALVEKYPLNAEMLAVDYIKKFGYDQLTEIMVSYFIEKKTPIKALNLIDFIKNNPAYISMDRVEEIDTLAAFALAASGDVETACEIRDNLAEMDIDKKDLLVDRLQFYYLSGKEAEYAEEIETIKNELIIISKERVGKDNQKIDSLEDVLVKDNTLRASIISYENNVINGEVTTKFYVYKIAKDENGNVDQSALPTFDPEYYTKKKNGQFVFDYYHHNITVAYLVLYTY